MPSPATRNDPDQDASALFLQSTLREKLLEHLFVGDLLRTMWRQGRRDIEILRAEVDSSGYDLVLDYNGIVRHVQLKSSHQQARTRSVNVAIKLSRKPAGCVIWIEFDAETLELGPYRWLGGASNAPLLLEGYRPAHHTRRGRGGVRNERPGLRTVGIKRFQSVETMQELIERLFGDAINSLSKSR
jgi:hypothetical protein